MGPAPDNGFSGFFLNEFRDRPELLNLWRHYREADDVRVTIFDVFDQFIEVVKILQQCQIDVMPVLFKIKNSGT